MDCERWPGPTVTLLMATLSAAPDSMRAGDALEALGSYGQVPECVPLEDLQRDSGAFGGRTHTFSPLPALEGKATALIPFTRHADRRVVLRAARLLCVEGSAAQEVLGELPCVPSSKTSPRCTPTGGRPPRRWDAEVIVQELFIGQTLHARPPEPHCPFTEAIHDDSPGNPAGTGRARGSSRLPDPGHVGHVQMPF